MRSLSCHGEATRPVLGTGEPFLVTQAPDPRLLESRPEPWEVFGFFNLCVMDPPRYPEAGCPAGGPSTLGAPRPASSPPSARFLISSFAHLQPPSGVRVIVTSPSELPPPVSHSSQPCLSALAGPIDACTKGLRKDSGGWSIVAAFWELGGRGEPDKTRE